MNLYFIIKMCTRFQKSSIPDVKKEFIDRLQEQQQKVYAYLQAVSVTVTNYVLHYLVFRD